MTGIAGRGALPEQADLAAGGGGFQHLAPVGHAGGVRGQVGAACGECVGGASELPQQGGDGSPKVDVAGVADEGDHPGYPAADIVGGVGAHLGDREGALEERHETAFDCDLEPSGEAQPLGPPELVEQYNELSRRTLAVYAGR